LMTKTSVVQSLQIATTIIKSFYHDQSQAAGRYRQWGDDEDQKALEEKFISFLQERLGLMDVVIENVSHYHTQVKQKLKTLEEKSKVPDNVDEFIFAGSYTHAKTLESLLEFIEYLVLQSQNDSTKPNEFVSIGVANIENLWSLFVSGPNFNSDQNMFLAWINKQRLQQVQSQQNNYYQLVTKEQNIFTEEEKKFLFTNILCNPADVRNMPVSLVKVFYKYFKSINKAENNLNALKKKMKILRFDQLLGMDTLWSIALHAGSEKVKEVVHELLVDLHLKFDHANVTQEHKQAVINVFVEKCMAEMESGVVA